jgi:hypothetical protein
MKSAAEVIANVHHTVLDVGSVEPTPVFDVGSVEPTPIFDVGSVEPTPLSL